MASGHRDPRRPHSGTWIARSGSFRISGDNLDPDPIWPFSGQFGSESAVPRIEEGATIIGPAVIGPRATICTGAHVEQALVLPEATITADSPRTGILGDPTLLDGVWSR